MLIEAVDLFYLAMPVVTAEPDGSQDALLVRVRSHDGREGWGECEASPLTSIAAFVCPMSHGACRPVGASVLGERVDGPGDIARIARLVTSRSMDLLQAAHAFSGVEMALWDLLGRARDEPVWRLLGQPRAYPKVPYASQLFGDTAHATFERARAAVGQGFRAAKFGWGAFGAGRLADDRDQLEAAREGLGAEGVLLVDAGQIWGEDVEAAAARLPALEAIGATWLEEPFHGAAFHAYRALAGRSNVALAGGEASHNAYAARNLIDYGTVGYVQIDCGRIGGIGPARDVAAYAAERGVTYVNHTFTSHLALSASLQPFAGLADHKLCEVPMAPMPLALDLSAEHIAIDGAGELNLPDRPGLGIAIEPGRFAPYLVELELVVRGQVLYRTPSLA